LSRDLVGEFEAAATFEAFFRNEDSDMSEKLNLVRRWKSPEDWNVADDDGFPCCRKWPGLQTPSSPTP